MSEQKYCWVYVFAKRGAGGLQSPVKVGISTNPNARLATIQTACPFKVELVYVFECPSVEIAAHIERSFHETQRKARLHGEWFDYAPLVAIQLLCIAFRVAMDINVTDSSLIEPALDVAGVLRPETIFGLHVAPSARLQ